MEDDLVVDCIIVAHDTNAPLGNKETSEGDANDQDGLTDNMAAQDMDSDDNIKTSTPSKASTLTKRFNLSPIQKRKARARPRFQPQLHSDVDDDYAPETSENSDGISSRVGEPMKSPIDLRPKKTRKSQNTRIASNCLQTTDNMGTKRPRSPDPETEQPQKRGVRKPLDEADSGQLGGLQSNARQRPVPRIPFMGKGKPKDDHQNKPTKITSDMTEDSSSDVPLAIRRRQKKKDDAPAKAPTNEIEDDSDDFPLVPTTRGRLRARVSSNLQSDPNKPSLQPQKNGNQLLSHTIQDTREQLEEANQELDKYREALKKERAKNRGLEQQRLLWEAKKLTNQDEDEAVAQGRTLLLGARSSPSTEMQGESASTLQIPRAEYQRFLDLNKKLESRLWAAEATRLKIMGGLSDHNLKRTAQNNDRTEVKCMTEALISAKQEETANLQRQLEQERESAKQSREYAQQTAEKARGLVDAVANLTEKLQKREAAVKENKELIASKSKLQRKVDSLESELQKTRQQSQAALQSKSGMETRNQKLGAELDKQQATVEQLNEQIEDIQEELDWYKDQLEKARRRYREDMLARDREEHQQMLYILDGF
ncbi:hypothetical protein VMCG_03774 [Cytospora schulzeri]|uniref:Uncharacterized protein n=1 Tax=Cytospora schulzeri TaxID=448051 RepID=A0A423WV05_9PEZI|nr:hypothetical protein VMCG_03774 [Valsa malicola]